MTILTELLCDVNNLIFKYLYKFKVDIPINARVIAVQSLEIAFHLYCSNHVMATYSVFIDPNNFKIVTEIRYMI